MNNIEIVRGKELLKQLTSMRKEAAGEEKRIAEMQKDIDQMKPKIKEVSDVVTKGKRGKKPLGLCKIHGFEDYKKMNEKRYKLRVRKAKKEIQLAKIETMVMEAEEFIYTMDESEIRNILLYYCIDGKNSWDDVAKLMGEGYTAEACKQKYSRFMRVK